MFTILSLDYLRTTGLYLGVTMKCLFFCDRLYENPAPCGPILFNDMSKDDKFYLIKALNAENSKYFP